MYKLYEEVIVKELTYSLREGDRGRLVLRSNGLYLVDFGKRKGTVKSLYWVSPSQVDVITNKSNFIGE